MVRNPLFSLKINQKSDKRNFLLFTNKLSMRSFTKVLQAKESDDALIYCLTGLAACEKEDKVLPFLFEQLIEENSGKLKNIRKMEQKESTRTIQPIPFDVPTTIQLSSIQENQVPQKKNSSTDDVEVVLPIRSSRLTMQSNKFKAKGLDSVPTPGFQTALNAMGIKKDEKEEIDERLKGVEPRLLELIENEILMTNTGVTWDDVAGLEDAKQAVKEAIMLPLTHPELFTGLREPPKGVLFFGPPGTGKTMIAKALATFASSAGCTFFNISASSITSKWVGEGEKLVRALFSLARVKSPSIVFIDEIDSLLTKRGDNDFEASRRVKTEFLLQFEGVSSGSERVLILGSTNRPQDIDEAAKRRFTRRIYIPLPDPETRLSLVNILLKKATHNVTEDQIKSIIDMTEGYSCADITTLLRESAMIPLREMTFSIGTKLEVRPLSFDDIQKAAKRIRPSVSPDSIQQYLDWNNQFGYSS